MPDPSPSLEPAGEYQQLLETATSIIVRWDPQGRIRYINPFGLRFFGCSHQEELLGQDVMVVLPTMLRINGHSLEKLLQDMQANPQRYAAVACQNFRKSGEPVWINWTNKTLTDPQGLVVAVLSIGTDITELKNTEQALRDSETRLQILNENLENIVVQRTAQVRELARALTLAEQKEHQRLSLLLHEDLQQILFSATLRVDMLARSLPPQQQAQADIAEIKRLTQKAIQTSKTLALELNPPILEEEGLDVALKWLIRFYREHHGLKVSLHIAEPFKEIRLEERILLVQLVRELLSNVVKHARTELAEVFVSRRAGAIDITVSEQGVGFDVERMRSLRKAEKYFGLFGIEERLRLMGGRLEIDSSPGKGTTAHLIMPIPELRRV